MRRLQFMPYILVFFSIFLSTIIALIRHIDFITFFKKAIVFLLIIFFSSKIFINVIMDIKNEKKDEHKNNEQNLNPASDETDNDKLKRMNFSPFNSKQIKFKILQNPSAINLTILILGGEADGSKKQSMATVYKNQR